MVGDTSQIKRQMQKLEKEMGGVPFPMEGQETEIDKKVNYQGLILHLLFQINYSIRHLQYSPEYYISLVEQLEIMLVSVLDEKYDEEIKKLWEHKKVIQNTTFTKTINVEI